MSTRNIPGGEGRPAHKADNLTAICEPIVYKMWEPQHLTALWVSTARYRDTFTYLPYPGEGWQLCVDKICTVDLIIISVESLCYVAICWKFVLLPRIDGSVILT
jgi:hypothetical protein